MSGDDRPKKSWREIDQMRNNSAHRKAEPKKESRQSVAAQKQYKAQLDRLFDSGEAGKLLGKKVEAPSADSKLAKIKAVRDAIGRDDITRAVDALLAMGPLPQDEEVLTQALEHRNEGKIQEVLSTLLSWLERNIPKRKATLKARLSGMISNADEAETKELAQRVLDKL
jgi:hypothetical protein